MSSSLKTQLQNRAIELKPCSSKKAPIEQEPGRVMKLSYEKMVLLTDNFSESNCIGNFQFGKLYYAKIVYPGITAYFMVKKWEVPENCDYDPGDNDLRLMDEMILLRHEMFINHPGMLKLYGFCFDRGLIGAVYEFKPFDSLFNLIPKDGFTWLQRIKAALGLASVVRYLHLGKSSYYQPFVLHNLDAAHVVLDEDYNPKLCDFGCTSGGIFPNKKTYSGHNSLSCYGCIDIALCSTGDWSIKQDVFAFGVILLSLISKRVYTDEDEDSEAGAPFVFEWAFTEYEEALESKSDVKETEFSLVHKSLADEDDFCRDDGHKITMLALECVNGDENQRPMMKQVVKSLLKLELIGVNKVLNSSENGI
ncbi:hypothetical protein ABFS82_13G030700 [Erythranthe guttata]